MKRDLLKECVQNGREIEFDYQGRQYSITYGKLDGTDCISFCEFYKETTDVSSFDELLDIVRYGTTVREMWQQLDEGCVWIF
jgi:hypothetical protein